MTEKRQPRYVEVPFTYNLPDDYLAQTNNLGKTAEWTYKGPDKLWIFIDKETKSPIDSQFFTVADDGDLIPTPEDKIKVMIDCETNPLMCCLLEDDANVPDDFEQHTEETIPGYEYTRPLNPPPDHTYELTEIDWDEEAGDFVTPYPWKKPHVTWDDIRHARNTHLYWADGRMTEDLPQNLKDALLEYKQKLRDIPDEWSGIEPWKIKWPQAPFK